MHSKTEKAAGGIGLSILLLLLAFPGQAQTAGATLSGTITGPTGKAVAGASVTLHNATTAKAQTNAQGFYSLGALEPGTYELTVSAPAFNPKTVPVTLRAGAKQTLNLSLTPALSLQALGFPSSETKGNAREQALLNKRSHMLQIHQRLGLITTIPLIATVISGAFAGGKSTSTASRDLHVALGSTTAALYFATAYYAIRAPRIPGEKTRGPIRFHEAMAWIHGPGMILTPILGALAYSQRSQGQRVHGIAKFHGQVAIVTAVAYGLALWSTTWKSGMVAHDTHAFLDKFEFHHHRHPLSAHASPGRDAHPRAARMSLVDAH